MTVYLGYYVKSPCLWCEKRRVGCHSSCEEYQEYLVKIDAARKKRDEYLTAEIFESDARAKNSKRDGGNRP